MADHDAEQWYPTAAYLYVLQLDDLALAWEYLRGTRSTAATGGFASAGPRRRNAGGCACWKTRAWTRVTRIRSGFPTTRR